MKKLYTSLQNAVRTKSMQTNINYKIYDNLGRALKSGELINSISMVDYKDGIYWLHLLIKDQIIAAKKIIKI